jgi:hypothetical protein
MAWDRHKNAMGVNTKHMLNTITITCDICVKRPFNFDIFGGSTFKQ